LCNNTTQHVLLVKINACEETLLVLWHGEAATAGRTGMM
jgi:hypothetical protein